MTKKYHGPSKEWLGKAGNIEDSCESVSAGGRSGTRILAEKMTENDVELLPLSGKYYGTKIKVGDGIIKIWGMGHYQGEKDYSPSIRELEQLEPGEEFEICDSHYEKKTDYEIAKVIEEALKKHFSSNGTVESTGFITRVLLDNFSKIQQK